MTDNRISNLRLDINSDTRRIQCTVIISQLDSEPTKYVVGYHLSSSLSEHYDNAEYITTAIQARVIVNE